VLTSHKPSDVQCLLGFHTVTLDRKTYLRRAWVGGREGRKGREGEGREEGREGRREGGERLKTAQIVHNMKAVQLVWTSYHTFTYQSQ